MVKALGSYVSIDRALPLEYLIGRSMLTDIGNLLRARERKCGVRTMLVSYNTPFTALKNLRSSFSTNLAKANE